MQLMPMGQYFSNQGTITIQERNLLLQQSGLDVDGKGVRIGSSANCRALIERGLYFFDVPRRLGTVPEGTSRASAVSLSLSTLSPTHLFPRSDHLL